MRDNDMERVSYRSYQLVVCVNPYTVLILDSFTN